MPPPQQGVEAHARGLPLLGAIQAAILPFPQGSHSPMDDSEDADRSDSDYDSDDSDERYEENWESIIDEVTDDITRRCNRFLNTRKTAERRALAACMGQHNRLGGGRVRETRSSAQELQWQRPSAMFALPQIAVSLIVHDIMRDFKAEREPLLLQLDALLRELAGIHEQREIVWGEDNGPFGGFSIRGVGIQRVSEVLELLNTALTIGLEEGRPEIQSKACHLIYGIAIRPSYGVRSITPWMRKLIEKAEHSADADKTQMMCCRALLTNFKDDKYKGCLHSRRPSVCRHGKEGLMWHPAGRPKAWCSKCTRKTLGEGPCTTAAAATMLQELSEDSSQEEGEEEEDAEEDENEEEEEEEGEDDDEEEDEEED